MELLLLFSLIVVGLLAGIVGSLFGLGGGIFIIPILTVLYGVDASVAVPVSLVAIIATSIGGTIFYLENGVTNVRLGLMFEITTVIGSIIGALVAGYLENWAILVLFSAVILITSLKMILNRTVDVKDVPDGEFSYRDLKEDTEKRYNVKNLKSGLCGFSVAGALASMTGVGGGAIKVPIMNLHMEIPIKVATATSNYMVGITAFSGAIIYFIQGKVDIELAAFIAIGTFIGAYLGSTLSKKVDTTSLKGYFAVLLLVICAIMLCKAGGLL